MREAPDSQATCWTMIRGAARGESRERAAFAARYEEMVRRYLAARWRGTPLVAEIEDAQQEVFIECIRVDGVLEKVEAKHPGGFRAFFFGAVKNVALRFESERVGRRPAQGDSILEHVEGESERVDQVLDREWARCLMRQAVERHRTMSLPKGDSARRRVELLRLRFEEGLPIRAIAERWSVEAAAVHRAYRKAREEFRLALREVVSFHQPSSSDVDEECMRLLALLGGE